MSTYAEPYPDVTYELHDDGTGTPVLLLHGGGGPDSVANLREALLAKHRVLAPTHPGWEQSHRPDWFTGIDRLAEMYLDLLDDLDLTEVRVIGSSMGGALAAELAIRDRGRRISRLVLMDATGYPGYDPNFPDMPAGSEWAERITFLKAILAAYGTAEPTLPARLGRVRIPALVIWGNDDHIIPTAAGEAYAHALPDSRLTIIENAGHVPTAEQPETTLPLITDFIH